MSDRREQLESLIQSGDMDQAMELVRKMSDYNEGESFVFAVLKDDKVTPELVDAVLEAFIGTRPNYAGSPRFGGGHGGWVHSLSHFTEILWEKRLDHWIKRLNGVAFGGAVVLGDPNCCDRLVGDFGHFAKFDDHPADFALTPENLRWMDWEYSSYAKARIEAGKFESEAAFLQWKLKRPEMQMAFDYDAQLKLVNVDGIKGMLKKLQELGADVSEFDGLLKDLLTKQLAKLEADLPKAEQDWKRERIDKGLEKTRAALADC
ncbi:MAG: hypothetical protein ACOYUZ_00060 [Patescibacteria group bacterium]